MKIESSVLPTSVKPTDAIESAHKGNEAAEFAAHLKTAQNELITTNPVISIEVSQTPSSISDSLPTVMGAAQGISDELRSSREMMFKKLKTIDPLDPVARIELAAAGVQLDNARIQQSLLSGFVDGVKNGINSIAKMQ